MELAAVLDPNVYLSVVMRVQHVQTSKHWLAPNPCSISFLPGYRRNNSGRVFAVPSRILLWSHGFVTQSPTGALKNVALSAAFDCRIGSSVGFNNVAESCCELTQVPLYVRPVLLDPTPVQLVRRCGRVLM